MEALRQLGNTSGQQVFNGLATDVRTLLVAILEAVDENRLGQAEKRRRIAWGS